MHTAWEQCKNDKWSRTDPTFLYKCAEVLELEPFLVYEHLRIEEARQRAAKDWRVVA